MINGRMNKSVRPTTLIHTFSNNQDIGQLDLLLDFTVHSSKLSIYLQQLRIVSSLLCNYRTIHNFHDEFMEKTSCANGNSDYKKKFKCKISQEIIFKQKNQIISSQTFFLTNCNEIPDRHIANLKDINVFYIHPQNEMKNMILKSTIKIYSRFYCNILNGLNITDLKSIDIHSDMILLTINLMNFVKNSNFCSIWNEISLINKFLSNSLQLECYINIKKQQDHNNNKLVIDLQLHGVNIKGLTDENTFISKYIYAQSFLMKKHDYSLIKSNDCMISNKNIFDISNEHFNNVFIKPTSTNIYNYFNETHNCKIIAPHIDLHQTYLIFKLTFHLHRKKTSIYKTIIFKTTKKNQVKTYSKCNNQWILSFSDDVSLSTGSNEQSVWQNESSKWCKMIKFN